MDDSNITWAWPWWSVMVFLNVINLIFCYYIIKRSPLVDNENEITYKRRMRLMGIIFTVVGAYRSIFVSQYDPQLAWFDSIFNSSLLIRFFAIFAELSFSGLIAYSMIKFNEFIPFSNQNKMTLILEKTPYALVLSIFLAQFFATPSVVMKSELLWAIEETLWFVGFLVILPLALNQLKRVLTISDPALKERMVMFRHSAIVIAIWNLIYVGYGIIFHLGEMWRGEFSLQETHPVSIKEALLIVNETKVYGDWGFGFLFWHSAYFSVCVWIALFLMRAPLPVNNPLQYNKNKVVILLGAMIIALSTLIFLII
ncbi:MAG: hypothetical protein INQ03_14290 [Candidatus Heimdallarchaeota archaeon]|nr:hypothetical protein [Candidatus Heimdallarchaeota archaeon]